MTIISETTEYRLLTVSGKICFASDRREYATEFRDKRDAQGVKLQLVEATTIVKECD